MQNAIIFFFILLIFNISSANAKIIVTKVESRGTAYKADYKISYMRVSDPNDKKVIPINANIFYGATELHANTTYACDHDGSGLWPGVPGSKCVFVPAGSTWEQAEKEWIRWYGPTGPVVVGHDMAVNVNECIAFVAMPLKTSSENPFSNGPLSCTPVPPPNFTGCNLKSGPIANIALGDALQSDVAYSGKIEKGATDFSINFSCPSSAVKINVTPTGSSTKNSGDGVYDNMSAGAGAASNLGIALECETNNGYKKPLINGVNILLQNSVTGSYSQKCKASYYSFGNATIGTVSTAVTLNFFYN